MIKLTVARPDKETIDLGFGVKVTVRPLSTHVYRAALYSAERMVKQFAADQGLIRAAGGTLADIPLPHDRDGTAGLRAQFVLQCLARHAVISWEGVGDEHGQPLPVTPDAVDALIRDFPPLADRFETLYCFQLSQLAAEGNGSGAAPSGTSAAAPSTAGTA